MATNKIQILPDSTGQKIRTHTRTIGADLVNEQYVIPVTERILTGSYIGEAASVITVAADAATAARFMIWNPLASATKIAIKSIRLITKVSSVLVTVTAPRITVQKGTFTTADPTAAEIANITKIDSAVSGARASKVTLLTTGATVPANTTFFFGMYTQTQQTSVGTSLEQTSKFTPPVSDQIILNAGEYMRVWQSTAGTAADTRLLSVIVEWDEYTV